MKKGATHSHLDESLADVNPDEKESLREIWRLSEQADEQPDIPPEAIHTLWESLSTAARSEASAASPSGRASKPDRGPVRSRRSGVSPVWTSLAVVAVLLIAGVLLWLRPVEQAAPIGEQLSVGLPDGSRVELNSGSSIRYPRLFARNRGVILQGEAYFDVAHSARPFTVSTFNADVTVLGTTFNIKAWSDGRQPQSVVTLVSGSIELTDRNQSSRIRMEPGQTRRVGALHNGISEPDLETAAHAMAWRDGAFIVKNEQVGMVLEDIERRFGTVIRLNDNQYASKEVTFAVRSQTSAEEVIEILCHALGLAYRPVLGGYELYQP